MEGEFGDPQTASPSSSRLVRMILMRGSLPRVHGVGADPARTYRVLPRECLERRADSLSPLYTRISATGPSVGRFSAGTVLEQFRGGLSRFDILPNCSRILRVKMPQFSID